MDVQQFELRKREHIDQALDSRNQAQGMAGLEEIRLRHEALPELDFADIRIAESCLDRTLDTPFFVAGMTMGHPDAAALNRDLAIACEERG